MLSWAKPALGPHVYAGTTGSSSPDTLGSPSSVITLSYLQVDQRRQCGHLAGDVRAGWWQVQDFSSGHLCITTVCQGPGAHGGPTKRLGEPRSALRSTEHLRKSLPGLRGGWGNGDDVGRPSPCPDIVNTCLPGRESRPPSLLPDSSRSKGLTAPEVRTGVPLAPLCS